MVAWNTGNLRRNEPIVDDLTGLMVCTEYNVRTTPYGIPAIVIAHVKQIAINYRIFVNLSVMNVVQTTQMHSGWYEEIGRNDPAQRY